MSRATTRAKKSLPNTFAALNGLHPLRPIQDEIDLANAQEILDPLVVLSKRTKDQDDYLETLTTLVEKYEADQKLFDDDVIAVEILRNLMEGREMNASDLGRLLGNRALGAAILRGDRQLSKSHVLQLARYFAVSPALFLNSPQSAARSLRRRRS